MNIVMLSVNALLIFQNKRTVRENHNQRTAGERNQKLNRAQTVVKHLTEVDKRKEIEKEKTIGRKI